VFAGEGDVGGGECHLEEAEVSKAADALCAWQVEDDIWHVQSRDPHLSGQLLDMGMKRIARAVKGGHLHILETDQGITPLRPLMRRLKGRILR
jgi:hypothetical protein